MKFKDEIDFVEKVKGHTKITETELLRIGYMKLKLGLSFSKIGKDLKVSHSTISRLFNLKKFKEKRNEYINKNKDKILRKDREYYYKIRDSIEYKERRKLRRKNYYKENIKNKKFITIRKQLNKKYNSKEKAKRILVNEVFKMPKNINKSLWDGVGKWARKFENCLECSSSIYVHAGHGFCQYCYNRLIRINNPSYANVSKKRDRAKKNYKNRKSKFKKAKEILENGEVEITPKIQNILDHINN